MCLSSVYERKSGSETLVLDNVMKLVVNKEMVTLMDIMGMEATVYGVIKSIDLVKNTIMIDATD